MYVKRRQYRKRPKRAFKPRKFARKPRATRSTNRRVYKKRRLPFEIAKVKCHNLISAFTKIHIPIHPLCKKNLQRCRALAPNRLFTSASSTLGVGPGVQNYLDVAFLSIGQLQNLYNTTNPQGNTIHATQGFQANIAKWLLDNIYVEMDITNSSNTLMELDVYHWLCKEDTTYAPTTLWNDGLSDEQGNTNSALAIQAGVSMVDAISCIGQYWKLKKIYKFILNPGQAHKFVFTQSFNRMINNEFIGGSSIQTDNFLKNISNDFTYVIKGGVCTTTAGSGATFGPTKLDIVQSVRFTAKYPMDNIPSMATSSTLPSTGTLTSYNFGSGLANLPVTI